MGFQDFQGFLGAEGGMHTKSCGGKARFQNCQDMRIVVHDEHGLSGCCRLVRTPVFQGEETPCLRS